jgi:GNAT superfamily N-acetyltransferase
VPEVVEAAWPASEADLGAIAVLASEAIGELQVLRGGAIWRLQDGRPDDPRPSLEADLAHPDRLVLAGGIDGTVVGYAVARVDTLRDGSTLAVLTDLYVEPDARQVGVGEALMELAVGWARDRGCIGIDSLALPGDRHTKNFFETFGLVARAIVVHKAL